MRERPTSVFFQIFLLFLAACAPLVAGASGGPLTARLLGDVRPGPDEESSDPGGFVAFGGETYFAADDGVGGRELWVSDGTEAGTRLLKDVCPGPCAGDPKELTPVGDRLFFVATDPLAGRELWLTDGTAEGTRLVADLCPEPCTLPPTELTAFGDRLLLRADDGVHGAELWISDGSRTGTFLLADLCPGECRSLPRELTRLGDGILFAAGGEGLSSGLWRTDGTPEGTRLLSGDGSLEAGRLTPFDGEVYFQGSRGGGGFELWKSDGTEAGTLLVRDVFPGSASSLPELFTPLGDHLYFKVGGLDGPCALWRTDGTEAGTAEVLVFGSDSAARCPFTMTAAGGRLFFDAWTPESGREPWVSDGTAAGTRQVADLFPGPFGSRVQLATVFEGGFYFVADDNSGFGLWTSDGTAAGTRELQGFATFVGSMAAASGRLWLGAGAGEPRRELWVSDGTAAGTRELARLRAAASSRPEELTSNGEIAVFRADDGLAGEEPWATGGLGGSTVLVADLLAGAGASRPHDFVFRGDELFLAADADDGPPRVGLWWLEEPSSQAVLLRTFGPVSVIEPAAVEHLTVIGDRLFFAASTEAEGIELWASDGTEAGTGLVADVDPGEEVIFFAPGIEVVAARSSKPRELTGLGGTLFFVADEETTGSELWASDGTAAGTRRVRDVFLGEEGSEPRDLAVLGGRLYFSASTPENGRELWSSDGTEAGTRLVGDLLPGAASSAPAELTVVGDRLYFFAAGEDGGHQLWASDGTGPGTAVVRDLRLGGAPATASGLLAAGSRLFFAVFDEGTGQELWTSDGTPGGTRLVRDLRAGEQSSYPQGLSAFGPLLLFAADDGASGLEPWVSDGTPAGTFQLAELAAGPAGSAPSPPVVVGSSLVFAASGDGVGREPWAFRAGEVSALFGGGCTAGVTTLCLEGGRFSVEVDWRDHQGASGPGRVVPFGSDDSGLMWFFHPDNWELLVKVLDGCGVNGHYWVFAAATTDVEYTLRVTDTLTGEERAYANPLGRASPAVTDTRAFATCP